MKPRIESNNLMQFDEMNWFSWLEKISEFKL